MNAGPPHHSHYSLQHIRAAAHQWEQLEKAFIDSIRVELHESLPRLQKFALEALERDEERIKGERSIARKVLEIDIPQKRARLSAAYDILSFGDLHLRFEYSFAVSAEERTAILDRILRNGGFQDSSGRFREVGK